MPDLVWEEVRDFFDPDLMGALPDGHLADTSAEDWQALLDLALGNGWAREFLVDDEPRAVARAADLFGREPEAEHRLLRIRPFPGVLVNFWPTTPDEITFDVDLRELQGQEGVDRLCAFLTAVGRALGRAVGLGPEMDPGHPFLAYDPDVDRVVLLDVSRAPAPGPG